ncbi:MAG: TonB-dependent receptor [Acidobacteriota bacterium]
MRVLTRAVFGLACLLFIPAAAYAQASIAGTVKDPSGAVLPGVTVEATSPVLIEKVRSAVTDGAGHYQIVDLRPGSYTMTFTLTGFSIVRRDGVQLTGSFTATINAELKVGTVQETITVTGETPMVDVSSTRKQVVLDHDAVQNLPSSRQYFTLARMAAGTSGGGGDVGGSAGIADVGQSLTAHGSKAVDQRVMLNGVSIMTLQAGGNIGGQQPDVGSAAEIAIDTSSLSAEGPTGGVRINFIPKDGGNTFGTSTFFTFANESMQGTNYTDALKAAGLATPTKIRNLWDFNGSVGGPIVKDKAWFWFSTRFNRSNSFAGVFENKNAFNPNAWIYVPDESAPAENHGEVQQNNLRITWQVAPRVKVAFEQKVDTFCNCPYQAGAIAATSNGVFNSQFAAPEAARDRRFPRLRQEHVEFSSPVTSKLLFEFVGMHLFERWGNMDLRSASNGGSLTDAEAAGIQNMISVADQGTGRMYRSFASTGFGGLNNTLVPNYTYRVAASYVTGGHNFKTGWNDTWGYQEVNNYAYQPISYTFNQGVPTFVTQYAAPITARSEENHDFGAFAQDTWKLSRATLTGAIRYDWFKTSFPEQTIGPGPALVGLENRNIHFPAQDNTDWKDLTYRSGAVFDLFGNGKSAVKVAANKYLLGQTLNALGAATTNPVNAMQTFTSRSWSDSNSNFAVDCNLASPLAQNLSASGGDNCGQIAQSTFGTTIPGATFDKDLLTGWGHRASNWEFSAAIQQQLHPRISIDVGYYRRIWQNFPVVDNVLAAASDFQAFTMTTPSDARLPGGGGQALTYYNIIPTRFGQTQNNYTLASKFGNEYEHWDGFDISVNGRLANGLRFQAGTGTGRTVTDNCEIIEQLPEMLSWGATNAAAVAANGAQPQLAKEFCHLQEPWLTGFKGLVFYTIPKADVQVAATFRSTPGAANAFGAGAGGAQPSGLAANFAATNAYLAANSNLGRALSGNAANTTVVVVNPDTLYLERDHQLDFRIGKVLKLSGTRTTVNFDMYNLLNRGTVVTANQTYSLTSNPWLTPTAIANPRLYKVSFTFDIR